MQFRKTSKCDVNGQWLYYTYIICIHSVYMTTKLTVNAQYTIYPTRGITIFFQWKSSKNCWTQHDILNCSIVQTKPFFVTAHYTIIALPWLCDVVFILYGLRGVLINYNNTSHGFIRRFYNYYHICIRVYVIGIYPCTVSISLGYNI